MRALLPLIGLNLLSFYLLAIPKAPLLADSLSFGKLEGYIYDKQTKKPVSFATISLLNTTKGNYSDLNGYYSIEQLPTGVYDIEVTFTGYEAVRHHQVVIKKNQSKNLDFSLATNAVLLKVIEVRPDQAVARLKQRKVQLSKDFLTNIPSGGDIMQIMEVVPGVSSPPGFNNELNIRGGASFENKFLVDGIEIPIINHFANTGTNGGFRSILHHKSIRTATLHTSQMPINVGNVSSGVFDFQLMEGNTERIKKSFVGSTADASILIEGPLSKQANFLLSFRQAYLKPTLTLLKRPILSTYNDWLYKFKWTIKPNHLLTLLGVGCSDGITENFNVPPTTINQYLLSRLSTGSLWHTFNALKYQNLRPKGYTTIQLAAHIIKSQVSKDEINPSALFTNRVSKTHRKQAKLGLENVQKWGTFDFRTGFQVDYTNFNLDSNIDWKDQETTLGQITSNLSIFKWNAFIEIQQLVQNRFFWSIGARIDADSYTKTAPFRQFSPRLSLSYQLNQQQSIYIHAAQYFQLPPTITLAYRTPDQELVNQATLTYFSTRHLTLGWKLGNEKKAAIWKIELFKKGYTNYPASTNTQLPLSAIGNDLPTFDLASLNSDGQARAYGLEVTWHPLLSKGYYGLLTYTFNKSEFKDKLNGGWKPTNYDAKHILNITGGKKMNHNWHIGFVFRLQTGVPYTPWDIATSSQIDTWATTLNVGVLDYEQVNTHRTKTSATLDLRIDKTFIFRKTKLKAYLDFLNMPVSGKTFGRPLLTAQQDEAGLVVTVPNNPQQLVLQQIDNNLSSMIPSLGLSMNF